MEENLNKIVEEAEEDDEGPPPGFDSLTVVSQNTNVLKDDEAEEDPPPGWPSISHQQNQQLPLTTDVEMGSKEHESEDDEDGPPPGWDTVITQKKLPATPVLTATVTCEMEKKEEVLEDEDNGPPPGWQLIPERQPLQTSKPPPGTQQAPLVDIEMGSKQDYGVDKEGHPVGSESFPVAEHSLLTPPLQSSSSVASSEMEMVSKQESTKNEEVRAPVEKQPMSHLQQVKPIVAQLTSHAATVSSDMGQMVCGSCRQLLSYPQGAKLVKCSCCQTINFVLEAHDVGQVKCGGCAVLLMYPYGAPSVRCSSCRFMTKIGAHNKRLPLSVQQARRRHASHQVH